MSAGDMAIVLMGVMVAHWWADFVFQWHWMSVRKSSDNYALSVHVLTYSAVMYLGTALLLGFSWAQLNFIILNGLAHWVQDYFTSRLTSAEWKKAFAVVPPDGHHLHNFFVIVGLDQLMHYMIMFAILVVLFP